FSLDFPVATVRRACLVDAIAHIPRLPTRHPWDAGHDRVGWTIVIMAIAALLKVANSHHRATETIPRLLIIRTLPAVARASLFQITDPAGRSTLRASDLKSALFRAA